jgi:hypothetical protein
MWKHALFGLVALSMEACTFGSTAALSPEHSPPRAPSSVRVYATDRLDRPHDVIGFVAVQHDGTDGAEAVEELRKQAASMGADAVIGVTVQLGQGGWAFATHTTGTAVRFR